ncbi:hypothetical protein ACKWTF_009873 [Chironomus riparius]
MQPKSAKFVFLIIIALNLKEVVNLKTFATMSKKKTEKECQILPKVSKPKLLECCALPDFFKSDVRETCVSECSDSDADQDPWCCMTTCAMEETELGSNGTINKASVKKYFYDIFISIEIRKLQTLKLSIVITQNMEPS